MSLYKTQKKPVVEEKITEHLSVGLFDDGKVMTMIHGVPFVQCRGAVITASNESALEERIGEYRNMDEFLAARSKEERALDDNISGRRPGQVSPETEFFVHKSNLEAWAENGYLIDVIDSRIAFPILLTLQKYDYVAKNALYYEAERRLAEGNETSRRALVATLLRPSPEGDTVDPAFFARLFGMMDKRTKEAVMSSFLPIGVREEIEKRFGVELDPRRMVLSIFLRVDPANIKYNDDLTGEYIHDATKRRFDVLTEKGANEISYDMVVDFLENIDPEIVQESTSILGIPIIMENDANLAGRDLVEFAADTVEKFSRVDTGRGVPFYSTPYGKKVEMAAAKIRSIPMVQESTPYGPMNKIIEAILSVDPGIDNFVKEVIGKLGRGGILATKDGVEHSLTFGGKKYNIYEME